MAIDPRIPLMGNAPPQFDMMGTLGKIAQIKRMEAISQQEQQEMALRQQEAQENEQFKQVLANSPDLETAKPKLFAINAERAAKFFESQARTEKVSAETSAFTREQQENERFREVLTTASDLTSAMPELMKINPKRALEFQKLQREAEGTGDFSTETVESGEIMAFNKRTGKFEPTGQRASAKEAAAGTLEAQAVARREKELGRPLTAAEMEELHGRWGKADDRPITVRTGGDSPLVAIVGPDGKPVLVPRSQAVGKTPASTRDSGGGRGVTSGDANRIADFDTSLDDVKVLRDTISGIKSTGTAAAAGAALWNPITELTGIGTQAKQKQAVIDRVKQVIGKALEGGVLRKEDEYKYTKILPTIGDTPAVAKAKLDGLEAALKQRKSTLIDSLDDAGYNTDSYKSRGGNRTTPPPPADGVERWERGPDGKMRKVKS